MMENILKYNGFNIALAGITIVFAGLVLIALTIQLFNYLFTKKAGGAKDSKKEHGSVKALINTITPTIPDDELVAIAAAIECYRRIHFDDISGQITFKKGTAHNAWRTGSHFGQRYHK